MLGIGRTGGGGEEVEEDAEEEDEGGEEEKKENEGVGGTYIMLDRKRMHIDPRIIPTMSGRSTSGFQRPGRHCLHRA